jgi:cell division protein FtsI (penicillin-binding protein 3)
MAEERRPRVGRTPPAGRTSRSDRVLRDGGRPRPSSRTRRPPTTRSRLRRTGSRVRGPVLRLPLAPAAHRLHVVLIVAAIALSLCAGRLLQLQGFASSSYPADALLRTLPLLPARGEITDRNGLVLAATQPAVAVTADPTLTGPRAAEVAEIVSRHLEMPTDELMKLLTKPGTQFVYLKKQVPALTYSALAAELSDRKIYGVFRKADPIRNYPAGRVGSSVVGFVGADGQGQGGLERKFNTDLAGVEGVQTYESAPNGSRIPLGESSVTPAQNGMSYQLTLDAEVQWAAEKLVDARVKDLGADSAFAIVMDVRTGELLALANGPGFDPNRLTKADKDHRGNRAVSAPYEPGSVQKVLTAAALIDSGTATPETKVEVPTQVMSNGRPIRDAFNHESPILKLNLRGIIARSSNIGTVLLARQMPKETLYDYLTRFGLGSRTGIELPGESRGILAKPEKMAVGQPDQIAFGQALAVTGVQQAAAVASVVNGGVYHAPTIIKGVTDSAGQPVAVEHQPPRRVVSEETSAQIRDVMRAVVDSENGQKSLQLEGYTSGGKTGTAQRAVEGSKGYQGYVTSYVSFAPADDPRILTYVVVNNPKGAHTGSGNAAPVVKDLMRVVLPRYSVAPDAVPNNPKPIEWE